MFAPLRSSWFLRLIDKIAVAYLSARGNAVLSLDQALTARRLSDRLCRHVRVSGHLCTVRGRKPNVVKVLVRSLDAIQGLMRPGMSVYDRKGTRISRVAI